MVTFEAEDMRDACPYQAGDTLQIPNGPKSNVDKVYPNCAYDVHWFTTTGEHQEMRVENMASSDSGKSGL